MARLKEKFNFESGAFASIRDAAKEATGAYQDAARRLDTLKEWVLIEFGMPKTADVIHKLAHEQPVRFDVIGDLLHQRHILQIYPATEEYRGAPETLDDVFEEIIDALQKIENALHECVKVCDENGVYPLGRGFENLQMENSASYEKFLYAWQMYSEHEMGATSFENWIEDLFEEEGA
nr:MAG TPA: ferritin, LIPID BINDING PROTEIN [Caudoviricetes sp.]